MKPVENISNRYYLYRLMSKLTYAAVSVGLIFGSVAAAADFPTKAVTIVVPFPPGGTTDAITRGG